MGSGVRRLADIWRMLDVCLPGYRRQLKLHRYWVTHSGRTYRGLPKGSHGSTNPEIHVSHIRRLAAFFNIVACAERELGH
ncbi:MAG: hypothetical protein AB1806_00440 [Acidobacteriota bacterium]